MVWLVCFSFTPPNIAQKRDGAKGTLCAGNVTFARFASLWRREGETCAVSIAQNVFAVRRRVLPEVGRLAVRLLAWFSFTPPNVARERDGAKVGHLARYPDSLHVVPKLRRASTSDEHAATPRTGQTRKRNPGFHATQKQIIFHPNKPITNHKNSLIFRYFQIINQPKFILPIFLPLPAMDFFNLLTNHKPSNFFDFLN